MIGAAIAIDEYVPNAMPINRASENPLKTSPPNRTIASTERKTSPDVIIVRDSVWFIESFVIL